MTAPAVPALRSRFSAALVAYFGAPPPADLLDALVGAVRPPPNTPAAVEAYREAAGRYPPSQFREDMVMAVQDKVEFWGEVCRTWVLRGYNPLNIEGMFAWFKAGTIPPAGPRVPVTEPRGFDAIRRFSERTAQHGDD